MGIVPLAFGVIMSILLNFENVDNTKPFLFPLGSVVCTASLQAWAEENLPEVLVSNDTWKRILVNAHVTGCWDELDPEDRRMNEMAIDADNPERVFSHYSLLDQKVYVITEWDRSCTTLLLPEDY